MVNATGSALQPLSQISGVAFGATLNVPNGDGGIVVAIPQWVNGITDLETQFTPNLGQSGGPGTIYDLGYAIFVQPYGWDPGQISITKAAGSATITFGTAANSPTCYVDVLVVHR